MLPSVTLAFASALAAKTPPKWARFDGVEPIPVELDAADSEALGLLLWLHLIEIVNGRFRLAVELAEGMVRWKVATRF